MNTFFGKHKFYVKNKDNLIYEVNGFQAYNDYNVIKLNLILVAGWDYVNPDMNDEQGYVPANRFIEDLQTESVNVYIFTETVKDALNSDGYEIIEKLPESIKKIIASKK